MATMRITSRAGMVGGQNDLHYRTGKANVCPCCGGQQWLVGRVTAECGLCETSMLLKELAVVSREAVPAIMVRASRTA